MGGARPVDVAGRVSGKDLAVFADLAGMWGQQAVSCVDRRRVGAVGLPRAITLHERDGVFPLVA
ncbi:MAG: hypothetical protein B7Y80_11110 [Hyphomicrobium sp. 32-62-53]|nr:MAG: hypothetical protein B7Y80_11110 [Hyphomicrobium sp. 32-62-53]